MSVTTTTRLTDDDADVMGAVDQSGGRDRFIIADLSRENAWLAIPDAEAAALQSWR